MIASALDGRGDPSGKRRWTEVYTANLAGAVVAAATAPLLLMPALGLRGSLWLCFVITAAVCAATATLPVRAAVPSRRRRNRRTAARLQGDTPGAGRRVRFGAIFFALEVIWTHLVGVVIGSSIYAFSSMRSPSWAC